MIAMLGARLGMIHLADWNGEKRPTLGEGRLNIPAVAEALKNAGFDKWIVLEEETKVGEARPQVKKGIAVFRATFKKGN
jgi:sugar phosphate isomerase/epimerase